MIQMVVFDMAGTVVRDENEVEMCFLEAAENQAVVAPKEKILAMMGWSKRLVFETLLQEQLGAEAPDLQQRVDAAYGEFCRVLENHYKTQPVAPTDGCLECFDWLRSHEVRIALTTGFYRKVTDIILRKLGWDQGLDKNYMGGENTTIQVSITSDQVSMGRPAPYMIHKAMAMLGVIDVRQVVKVGDTPVDLEAGKNAGCGLTLGVTNGTHTAQQLSAVENDGLLGSLLELKDKLSERLS